MHVSPAGNVPTGWVHFFAGFFLAATGFFGAALRVGARRNLSTVALGPPKNRGAQGVVMLPLTVVALLRSRRVRQAEDRLAAGDLWETVAHDGRPVDLVFTTSIGGLVGRQRLTKVLATIALGAGIDPTGLGTHSGRRSLVTALHSAGLDLGDISRHVGHASASTTAGYVAHLADRPEATSRAAAALVDGR